MVCVERISCTEKAAESGERVADGAGAGLRQEHGHLTLRREGKVKRYGWRQVGEGAGKSLFKPEVSSLPTKGNEKVFS